MRPGSWIIILYIISWIILLYILTKKVKDSRVSVFIIGTYILYGIMSLIHYNNSLIMNQDMRLFPFVYLFIMLYLSIKPAIQYDEASAIKIEQPDKQIFKYFTIFYILLSIFLMPQYLSNIQEGITTLLADSSGGLELYEESHTGELIERSYRSIPSFVYSMFSYVSVLIFFYYITLSDTNKFILIGLLLSMVVNLLNPISNGLRTSTVMLLFAIAAAYFLFLPYFPKKTKKNLSIGMMVVLGFVVFLIIVLTISRFDTKTSSAEDSVISYLGQANLNFNKYGLDAGGIRYGDRTCRIFKEILGFPDVPDGPTSRRWKYAYLKIDDYRFYTFVGDFTIDFGPFFAVLIFLFFSLFFVRFTKPKNGVISFSQLIVLYLAILIPLQGGMYLFNFSDGGNYKLIGFMFCALLFSIKLKK